MVTATYDLNGRVTVREASIITGRSTDYLRVLIRAGKLNAVKVGHQYLVLIPAEMKR